MILKRLGGLYADVWLGFSQNKLYQLLKDAGFKQIEINIVSKETEEPYFQTILASAVKVNLKFSHGNRYGTKLL